MPSRESTGISFELSADITPAERHTDDDLIGQLLRGKWRVERLLGRGGMSSVYAATHRNGRRVAIKVLSPELRASPRNRYRFLREGYIANRVRHDGAVSVLDDDLTDEGIVFLVMDLLDGETLSARCRRSGERLGVCESLLLIDGLLDILSAAHANGIIHRDIKPSNLFLTRRGELKLLDFGIASLRETVGGLADTHSGKALGTPGFMAPEQARGCSRDVTFRTDIWATGATLFRLLTGRLVHESRTVNEALIAAATTPVASLRSLDNGIGDDIVELVDTALRFEPAERWRSAAEMRMAVQGALAKMPAETSLVSSAAQIPEDLTDPGSTTLTTFGDRSEASLPTATPRVPRRSRRRTWARSLAAAGVLGILSALLWRVPRPASHAVATTLHPLRAPTLRVTGAARSSAAQPVAAATEPTTSSRNVGRAASRPRPGVARNVSDAPVALPSVAPSPLPVSSGIHPATFATPKNQVAPRSDDPRDRR